MKHLFLIIFPLLFAACSVQPDASLSAEVPIVNSATPVPTETPPPPTETPSPSPTPIPTSTFTPEPTFTASPTETPTQHPCLQEGGRITQHTLATDLSPLPWQFRVYTPPCYEVDTETRYPLLVLIHGSTYTDSQWDDLGADETADRLIAAGEVPPFIMLMPRDRIWVEPNEDPFGEAVISRIIPWVDSHFRTNTERPFRAIGGLSRGASWAVHLGLKHWNLFSAIGAHSLPVFLTDPPRIQNWLTVIPAEQIPKIYMDIGDKDYLLDKAAWFETLLTEKNIPHEWYLNSGTHEDAYWQAHMEEYLRWYSTNW